MIDYGIAPSSVLEYISVTRGRCKPYTSPILSGFFADCTESLRYWGFDASHVRISLISSDVGDVETLHINNRPHIVYDSGLYALHFSIISSLFESIMPSLSFTRNRDAAPHVSAIYAARYLSGGHLKKAALNAHLALTEQRERATRLSNPDVCQRWATVMSAYSIAHELAHCTVKGSSEVIARQYADRYEENILPYVRYLDVVNPVQLIPDVNGHPADPLPPPSSGRPLWEPNADELEEQRAIFEEYILPVHGRRLTLEERLDTVISTLDGVGEEVICDAIAIQLTIANLGGAILPVDQTAMACHMASQANGLIRNVDLALKPVGLRGERGGPISYQDKVIALTDVWDTFATSWLRRQFSVIWSTVIFRAYNSLSSPTDGLVDVNGVEDLPEETEFAQEERHLADTLNLLQSTFNQLFSNEVVSGCALRTDNVYISGGLDDLDFSDTATRVSLGEDVTRALFNG